MLDHTGSRVLLTLHPRLGRWVQLGGHCDEDDAALPDGTDDALAYLVSRATPRT